jgi:hypothetical protein
MVGQPGMECGVEMHAPTGPHGDAPTHPRHPWNPCMPLAVHAHHLELTRRLDSSSTGCQCPRITWMITHPRRFLGHPQTHFKLLRKLPSGQSRTPEGEVPNSGSSG